MKIFHLLQRACLALIFVQAQCLTADNNDRWTIASNDSICWTVNGAHQDHIEMSGLKISTVLRYGVDSNGQWHIDRNLVLPTFRTIPNTTRASLQHRFTGDCAAMVMVNGKYLEGEKVEAVALDGTLTVHSSYPRMGISLKRTLFPSMTHPAFCEIYELKNTTDRPLSVSIPTAERSYRTDPKKGVYGSYRLTASVSSQYAGTQTIAPGGKVTFQATYTGYKEGDPDLTLHAAEELADRLRFLADIQSNLILDTPNKTINTMFAFAKIRGAESIFDTRSGLMHSPGGEAYYAAVWANDQAEYINSFFPYLGYETGNQSAMNCFRLYMSYMNNDYRPLPSSIIAEGLYPFGVAGDRGDVAMVAYGAARYALASGNRNEAEELWPLIEWSLEYCRRKLNAAGVVTSDSDELENRFPAGEANLCTSSLYYDALQSAAFLADALHKDSKLAKDYRQRAARLYNDMDRYFARTVEGFDTYRYYDGNNVLRAWICIPLSMGIYKRAKGTVEALYSDKLWMENGLLTQSGTTTYWDRSTLYALRGTFACGERETALKYLDSYSRKRLLGDHVPYAVEAWPEGNQRHLSTESGLYCRIVTEGLFGIRPIGLHSFALTPQLPETWTQMSLKRIRAFGSDFDIEIKRKNSRKLSVTLKENNRRKTYVVENGKTLNIRLGKDKR